MLTRNLFPFNENVSQSPELVVVLGEAVVDTVVKDSSTYTAVVGIVQYMQTVSKSLPQDGSVPFHNPPGPQALSDDPPTSWYPGEQL